MKQNHQQPSTSNSEILKIKKVIKSMMNIHFLVIISALFCAICTEISPVKILNRINSIFLTQTIPFLLVYTDLNKVIGKVIDVEIKRQINEIGNLFMVAGCLLYDPIIVSNIIESFILKLFFSMAFVTVSVVFDFTCLKKVRIFQVKYRDFK